MWSLFLLSVSITVLKNLKKSTIEKNKEILKLKNYIKHDNL